MARVTLPLASFARRGLAAASLWVAVAFGLVVPGLCAQVKGQKPNVQTGSQDEGKIVRTGSPPEIFNDPRTEFIARFMGLKAIVEASASGDGAWWETEAGRWPRPAGGPREGRLLLRTDKTTTSWQVHLEKTGSKTVISAIPASKFLPPST